MHTDIHHVRGRNATPVSFKGLARTDPYELPCEIRYLQEVQLSQKGRATLRVVENFAIYIYLYSSKNDSNQTNRKEQTKNKKIDSEHNIENTVTYTPT